MPILFGMTQRLLAGVAVVLLGLILISRLRSDEPVAPVTPAAAVATPPPTASPATVRAPMVAPLPDVLQAPAAGTPTIDLMAVLAVRRRIEREGDRVYLDAMWVETDSTLVRWADRSGAPLRVAFVADTALQGWAPGILDAARAGLAPWNGNSANLRFTEVTDPLEADIVVSFVSVVSDSGAMGVTQTQAATSGATERVEINLALRQTEAGPLITPALLRRIATHEFGHAIGLPHSGNRGDLMYPTTTVASPSRRDQATLQLLYAVPPGSLRTP
jgi:hypothetical protein